MPESGTNAERRTGLLSRCGVLRLPGSHACPVRAPAFACIPRRAFTVLCSFFISIRQHHWHC